MLRVPQQSTESLLLLSSYLFRSKDHGVKMSDCSSRALLICQHPNPRSASIQCVGWTGPTVTVRTTRWKAVGNKDGRRQEQKMRVWQTVFKRKVGSFVTSGPTSSHDTNGRRQKEEFKRNYCHIFNFTCRQGTVPVTIHAIDKPLAEPTSKTSQGRRLSPLCSYTCHPSPGLPTPRAYR